MITKEQYELYKYLVEEYEKAEYEEKMREAEDALEWGLDDEPEPCPTCGEIDGMDNPCCPNYDPLSYKNCGYG